MQGSTTRRPDKHIAQRRSQKKLAQGQDPSHMTRFNNRKPDKHIAQKR